MRAAKLVRNLTLSAVALFAIPASADIQTNKNAGVQVDIPHAWKITPNGGDTITATDPNEEAAVVFTVSDGGDMKKVGDAIDAQLAKVAKDVKWGPQKKISLHGMDGIAMKGTAKMDGKAVNTGVIIVMSPKKKGVFLLGFVEASKEAAHKADLETIAGSIAPIK